LRPVRKQERDGEHNAVVCHCEYVKPLSAISLERWHIDPATEWRPGGETGVIVEDDKHVGRAFWCFVGQECRPVGFGIANVEIDGAVKWSRHY
jgi:hypothetical protein